MKCSQGLVYGLNGCDVLLFRRGAAAEVRLHVFVLQHFVAESVEVFINNISITFNNQIQGLK